MYLDNMRERERERGRDRERARERQRERAREREKEREKWGGEGEEDWVYSLYLWKVRPFIHSDFSRDLSTSYWDLPMNHILKCQN